MLTDKQREAVRRGGVCRKEDVAVAEKIFKQHLLALDASTAERVITALERMARGVITRKFTVEAE